MWLGLKQDTDNRHTLNSPDPRFGKGLTLCSFRSEICRRGLAGRVLGGLRWGNLKYSKLWFLLMANNTLALSLQVSEEEFSTFFGNSHLYFFLKFVYFVEATVGILVAKLNQSTKSKFVVNTLKLRDQSFFMSVRFQLN